ncbi:MAG TPA: ABC transporter permease, partial [Bacteroidia bacterium]|nr:ABC transporter permease [Bacteroidia bacterium]
FINFTEVNTIETPAEAMALNSVQHNVPAWTIFGMFFIVISMAGSIIKERDDGSYTRIRTMPGSFVTILTGKITAYLFVCIIQCVLMLLVGMYALPYLGLPALAIGNSIGGIILIALCTGLAATGFGVMTGTVFSTHQQSSTFGAVSIVILAALGGIWVPVYVMPETIQKLAEFSPLFWSLSAFHKLFLNNGSIATVLVYGGKLLVFFAVTILIAYFYRNKGQA